MNDIFFSGTAAVEIQGPCVLEFVSLDSTQAQFDIIGITDPKIRVVDLRPTVLHKMKEILKTDKLEQLAYFFNRPARVTILPSVSGQMVVRLEKTRAKNPHHMLWVAIGIEGDIPLYDYKRVQMQELGNNLYAFFAVYKRPHSTKNY
jgi:hypothetical protein